MSRRELITGAILAGGRGRRMDGADKGLLPFRGRPLISHVIDVIGPQVGSLIVSANRHQERYAQLGFPVVADHETVFAGPLAGIARVLEQVITPYMLVAPCDMPSLPRQLARHLMEALTESNAQAAVAYGAGRLQPLCVLLRRDVEEDLLDYREAGGAKVEQWLLRLRHVVVEFPNSSEAFCNINTPDELLAAVSISRASHPPPSSTTDRK
jgi:molybdopterin-guanine dinucleotide biosynthesis protein A